MLACLTTGYCDSCSMRPDGCRRACARIIQSNLLRNQIRARAGASGGTSPRSARRSAARGFARSLFQWATSAVADSAVAFIVPGRRLYYLANPPLRGHDWDPLDDRPNHRQAFCRSFATGPIRPLRFELDLYYFGLTGEVAFNGYAEPEERHGVGARMRKGGMP